MPYTTIEDIARKVNKSVATVSRVLNGKDAQGIPISGKTRELILRTAEELHYRPNYLAKNLVQGDSRVIGFVVPDIMQSYFNEICYHLSRKLDRVGYDIVLAHSYENPRSEKHSIEMLLSRRVSGIIISPAMGKENLDYLTRLRKYKIPLVLLDRRFPGRDFFSVTTDDVRGSCELTTHIIGQGARRIIFIAGNRDTSVSSERIEGYTRALETAGIPFDESLIVESGYFMEDGYRAVKNLLANRTGTAADAVIGVNDTVALGAMKALEERSLRVPGDIMVAGYSNDRYSDFFKVPLTTVAQPKEKIADTAVNMLMKIIRNERITKPQVTIACRLVVRASTVPAGR